MVVGSDEVCLVRVPVLEVMGIPLTVVVLADI